MSSCQSPCSEDVRAKALELGAAACGFARAEAVSAEAVELYESWIQAGCHGGMHYCEHHADVRRDPRLLLPGARTVVSCAFAYRQPLPDLPLAPHVSMYAWGADYHWAVKARLLALADYITDRYGGECRVCVDSAPIRERYWAQRAGVGFVGRNGLLIVPGAGSTVFLGEVLWTGTVEPDEPCAGTCAGCGACVRACPLGALDSGDARRCLSYLTIEHRGELPEHSAAAGATTIYGCDICQRVCPHNAGDPVATLPDFAPDAALLGHAPGDFLDMTPSHFRRLTRASAMSRIPLRQLQRNILAFLPPNLLNNSSFGSR